MSDLRRFISGPLVALGMGICLLVGPSVAFAEANPTIDGEWVSGVTEHDATLNAKIDPNGVPTWYFFEIDTIRSDNFTHIDCPFEACTVMTAGPPLPPGLTEPPRETIPASEGDQVVSVDMSAIGATLEPATTYFFRVIAHVAPGAGDYYATKTAYGREQSFTTLSPYAPVTQPDTPPVPLNPLQGLEGDYRGFAITGVRGRRPVGRPRQLRLSLGMVGGGSGSSLEEHPTLSWEASCNSHSYALTLTASRFELGRGVGSKVGCGGRAKGEERWLERFFDSDPRWKSTNAGLTLMSRGRSMVLRRLT